MKRVIKFRIWDSKKGEWLEDFTLYPNGKVVGVNHAYGNIHVVEFTGLKDKNGNEIYEGDIMQTDNYNGKHLFRVDYETDIGGQLGAFTLNCIDDEDISSVHSEVIENGEIIGNVFENPDLLK